MEQSVQFTALVPSNFTTKKLVRQLDFRKQEPPNSNPLPLSEVKDDNLTGKKNCGCKKSRCLKQYCECFSSMIYCDGCNCVDCCNNVENEAVRYAAVEAILGRDRNAFKPKIGSKEVGEIALVGKKGKHCKGCNCKRSGCLKKYCECFQAGILCSENCKCTDCKNFEGSEERKSLFPSEHGNTLAYNQQQATNATFNGAIGASGYGSPASKKRKNQEPFLSASTRDQHIHNLTQIPQASKLKASGPGSSSDSIPIAHAVNPPPGLSEVIHRSLLADSVQPDDIKMVCTFLVAVSKEAAKAFPDKKAQEENLAEGEDQTGSSLALSSHNESQKDPDVTRASSDDGSIGTTHADKASTEESGSECANGHEGGRPMSPGTMALMCDEQDTLFMASQNAAFSPRHPYSCSVTDVYAEQERSVLTKFRDCLWNLITRGVEKGSKYPEMATKSETRTCQKSEERDIM